MTNDAPDTTELAKKIKKYERVIVRLEERIEFLEEGHAKNLQYLQEIHGQKTKIQQLFSNLNEKTRSIEAMLENAPLGICAITPDLTIHHEYSRFLEDIFEQEELAGKCAIDVLTRFAKIDGDKLDQMQATLRTSLSMRPLNFAVNAQLLPRELELHCPSGTKIIELDWATILDADDERVDKILVIVKDTTKLKELEAASARRNRDMDIVAQILDCGQRSFKEFEQQATDSLARVDKSLALETPDVEACLRELHTLKGLARFRQLLTIADHVHHAENALEDMQNFLEVPKDYSKFLQEVQILKDVLAEHRQLFQEKLGANHLEHPNLSQALEKLEQIAHKSDKNLAKQLLELKNMLGNQTVTTVFSIFKGFETGLSKLSEELGKPLPKLYYLGSDVALTAVQEQYLVESAIHIFTNAVVHGIEQPKERRHQNKPATGQIFVTVSSDDHEIKIDIQDDGQGLDLEKIRERADLLGLAVADMSQNELAEAIFTPGLSTFEEITHHSGRGVGLDAARQKMSSGSGYVHLELLPPNSNAEHPIAFIIFMPK